MAVITMTTTTIMMMMMTRFNGASACNSSVLSSCLQLDADLFDRFSNHSFFPAYDNYTLHSICRFACLPSSLPLSVFLSVCLFVYYQRWFFRNTATRCSVHWPLMGGLLHLVQRGGAWAGCGPRVISAPAVGDPFGILRRCLIGLLCGKETIIIQLPSPLVWRHYMRYTVVQNSYGQQVVWCRRTAALEQAACFTAVIWQSLPIEKTVENVFVCQGLGCGA